MTAKFGWCLDALCHKCIKTTESGLACSCGCHNDSPTEKENDGNVSAA